MNTETALLAALFALTGAGSHAPSDRDASAVAVFSGASPGSDALKSLLAIPPEAAVDIVEWRLTLNRNPGTSGPTTYELRCDYGPSVSGIPGLGRKRGSVERRGSWRIGKGTKANAASIVYELDGAVSFLRVTPHILHVLSPDRSLMVGNGGWSYTLYREGATETPVDPSRTAIDSPDPGRILPRATGPAVFGVFEGRSPCHGAARILGLAAKPGCMKVKWRLTLFRNPETRVPTTYRVEGTLHRNARREGAWEIIRGTPTDRDAIVYRLAPTRTEQALHLLQGDDNVLFFLDNQLNPLVGTGQFSYTLNRAAP